MVNPVGEPDMAEVIPPAPIGTLGSSLTSEQLFYYNTYQHVYLEAHMLLDRLAL
jgi:hypothetical protein